MSSELIHVREGITPISAGNMYGQSSYQHERGLGVALTRIFPDREFFHEPLKLTDPRDRDRNHFYLPDFGLRRGDQWDLIEVTLTSSVEYEIPFEDYDCLEYKPTGSYQPIGFRYDEEGQEWVKFRSDPKAHTRNLVNIVNETTGSKLRLIVLYRQQFEKLQQRFPDIDFGLSQDFSAK